MLTTVLSTLYFPLLIFLIYVYASPEPYPALSVANRAPPPVRRISTPPPPDFEFDVLPYVLISTIDGALHAVDRDAGKIKWSLKEGEPLVGGGGKTAGREEQYIVEPLSGSLYVFEDEQEEDAPKVRKLPLSVEQLIELSPFTFPHSPSRIFTGSKHTSLLTVDLRTGAQVDSYSSANFSFGKPVCEEELDNLEGHARTKQDILYVGRTDFRLTIHNPPAIKASVSISGEAEKLAESQEIVYSTYTPNTYDRPLAEYWAKAGSSDQIKTRVELGHDGVAVGVEEGGGVRWITSLGSIGIAVYDIVQPTAPRSNPILLPQPPPHLPSLFPLPANPHPAHLDVLTKPPSTYIGQVSALTLPPSMSHDTQETENASDWDTRPRLRQAKPLLYALSSSSYPLINFAPPPRPGSLTNGSFLLSEELPERDQLLPYLLDPPHEETGLIIPESSAVQETWGIKEKESPSGFGWYIFSGLSGVLVCALAVFGHSKRKAVKIQPIDEATPLLEERIKSEKTVTIIEPSPESKVTLASAIATPDEETATPKKKSTRRRVRGKKKRVDSSTALLEVDGEDEEEDDKDLSPNGSPPSSTGKVEKPLPELPREMTVSNSDKERLAISDTVIGFGSHGTVVLKGTWGGRPVAVKRLLSDFVRLADQEVKLLQASDDHQNVIRYYCQERRDNFLYIALDLCQASLADLIETPDKYLALASSLDRKKALSQISAGLKHLHGMKIIHRDIKPQNVLVSQAKDGSLRMLVSDFGLARRLEQGQSSFAPTANNLAGSLGWRAPECIRGQVRLNEGFERASSCSSSSSSSSLLDLSTVPTEGETEGGRGRPHRLTKAVDLFALGCLYFWVLMSGEHPFGETYNRESNIVKGDWVNMGMLDILGEEGWEAKDLIGRLLSKDPDDRPDTSECLTHPFFWTPAKRLAFLCDASDRFEIMELEPPEATLVLLETDAVKVVGKDWYSRLDKVFINNLGKYRKYKGGSVRDLLRAMRNKKHHYQDLEPSVKRHLGSLPTGFLHYFTSRFPTLFLHVYSVIKDSRLRHESMFEAYFQEGGG